MAANNVDRFSVELGRWTKEVRDKAADFLADGKGQPDTCLRMAEGRIMQQRELAARTRAGSLSNVLYLPRRNDGRDR